MLGDEIVLLRTPWHEINCNVQVQKACTDYLGAEGMSTMNILKCDWTQNTNTGKFNMHMSIM